MIAVLYLIIGAFIGYKEVQANKGSRQEFIDRDAVLFVIYLILWLPIYAIRYLKKLDFDLD